MVDLKKVTIQEVAKLAGVSMMTVSRTLNHNEKVSDKTREKVMKVVAQLNYQPNISARRLASTKSYFLGLVYNNPSDSYISQFLLAALKQSRNFGYHLVVEQAYDDIQKTVLSVKQLIEVTQVDGLILLPPLCDNDEIINLLTESNTPYVRVTPDTNLTQSPYICMDDYQAAFDVTEYLINQGHRKIAHVIGDLSQGVSRLRYQGYLDALRSNKIISQPQYIEQGSFTYQSGMEAAIKLLSLEDRPTAIFAANDDMAAAVISIAQKQGIAIPEQLSVVGFDDTQLATVVWPNITTVRQPINEMAELAISLLATSNKQNFSQLKGQALKHILDFKIIERESSGWHENY